MAHAGIRRNSKQLMGGERITARLMRQNFCYPLPQFKLILLEATALACVA